MIYNHINVIILIINNAAKARGRQVGRLRRDDVRGAGSPSSAPCPSSTAKIYTYTPIIQNAAYLFLIRCCKYLLLDMCTFLSCTSPSLWHRLHSSRLAPRPPALFPDGHRAQRTGTLLMRQQIRSCLRGGLWEPQGVHHLQQAAAAVSWPTPWLSRPTVYCIIS